jgi:hypothetical protein
MIFQAPERDLWIAGFFNDIGRYTLLSAEMNPDVSVTFSTQSARARKTLNNRPLPRWSRYPAGVIVLLDAFDIAGFDAVICGDEPVGPRYEYGLGLLFAALCHELADQPYLPSRLTGIADAAKREFVESAG